MPDKELPSLENDRYHMMYTAGFARGVLRAYKELKQTETPTLPDLEAWLRDEEAE